MPGTGLLWQPFKECAVCQHEFQDNEYMPISLGCGHTVCHGCLASICTKACPIDYSPFIEDIKTYPVNRILLRIVEGLQKYGTKDVLVDEQPEPEAFEPFGKFSNCNLKDDWLRNLDQLQNESLICNRTKGQNVNSIVSPRPEQACIEETLADLDSASLICAWNKNTSSYNETGQQAELYSRIHHQYIGQDQYYLNRVNYTNIDFNEIDPVYINKQHILDNYKTACNNETERSAMRLPRVLSKDEYISYESAINCIDEMSQYLWPVITNNGNLLSKSIICQILVIINCQLLSFEGRKHLVHHIYELTKCVINEITSLQQNTQQIGLNLWSVVRSRGCQFLGPSLQYDILRLVIKALGNGNSLSRKALVMYIVNDLNGKYMPATKTSVGHVIQLLYRASCFIVSKRAGQSSLMQLKEVFREYMNLQHEHDSQLVQIAWESGLRLTSEQWSTLLYGNNKQTDYMQRICNIIYKQESSETKIMDLMKNVQHNGDPTGILNVRKSFDTLLQLKAFDLNSKDIWQEIDKLLKASCQIMIALIDFIDYNDIKSKYNVTLKAYASGRYKISYCRDFIEKRICPRGENCTYAHTAEEIRLHRMKLRMQPMPGNAPNNPNDKPKPKLTGTRLTGLASSASCKTAAPGLRCLQTLRHPTTFLQDRKVQRAAQELLAPAPNELLPAPLLTRIAESDVKHQILEPPSTLNPSETVRLPEELDDLNFSKANFSKPNQRQRETSNNRENSTAKISRTLSNLVKATKLDGNDVNSNQDFTEASSNNLIVNICTLNENQLFKGLSSENNLHLNYASTMQNDLPTTSATTLNDTERLRFACDYEHFPIRHDTCEQDTTYNPSVIFSGAASTSKCSTKAFVSHVNNNNHYDALVSNYNKHNKRELTINKDINLRSTNDGNYFIDKSINHASDPIRSDASLLFDDNGHGISDCLDIVNINPLENIWTVNIYNTPQQTTEYSNNFIKSNEQFNINDKCMQPYYNNNNVHDYMTNNKPPISADRSSSSAPILTTTSYQPIEQHLTESSTMATDANSKYGPIRCPLSRQRSPIGDNQMTMAANQSCENEESLHSATNTINAKPTDSFNHI